MEPLSSQICIVSRGFGADARAYARKRIASALRRVHRQVSFVRVTLRRTADGTHARLATARVSVDVDGDLVHAGGDAQTIYEAIDLVAARLRNRLEHRAQHRLATRRRAPASRRGERTSETTTRRK